METRQDIAKELYKRETQTQINLFVTRGLNNTKYVGYLKCF
jgi:hypothetical protein